MRRWIAGTVWIGALLWAGCDGEADASGCDALGEHLAVGEAVADPEVGVRCVCTASGPECTPWDGESDGGRILDQGARPDGGRLFDAAPRPDQGADPDAARDDAQATDAAPPDASPADEGPPEACPAEIPFGQCGNADRTCGYGEPFTCCIREYEHRTLCRCEGGLWACEDRRETCLADDSGAACLRRAEVCEAWGRIQADRDADVDGQHRDAWDGSVAGCAPGEMPAEWRQRAFDRLNDWRYLADQPPARLVPERNTLAQHCALAMHARGFWTHALTPEDPCYSEEARQGAAESLVSMRGIAVDVLWNYVEDFGEMNFAAAPHRLWMFSNRLGPVGIGATDDATCMHVANARLESDRAYVPWPAAGPFPVGAALSDAIGWTVQSDSINFNGAIVRVTKEGEAMPVETRVLQAQYGASHALAFKPDGWAPQAGETYLVVVTGATAPVRYAVEFIDCAAE